MGIINVYKGLEPTPIHYNFNGRIKDNLELDWNYTKILLGNKELDSDYEVKENDIILINELHGITTAAVIVGVVSIGIAIGTGIYTAAQIKKAEKELKNALNRVGTSNNQKEISSIPNIGDAKNERADGKTSPLILGKHIFAPYFMSEPYMRIDTDKPNDGEDLYWYGSFLMGQDGLWIEKVRNGTIDLVNIPVNDYKPQSGVFNFNEPENYDSSNPPPFYDEKNLIEIVQCGKDFENEIFEEKWVDSLESCVEIGRKKKDGGGVIDVIFVDDDGIDPVIRETAKFPMEVEIEVLVDGLHGWDSQQGVATPATVDFSLEWSRTGEGGWAKIPITFIDDTTRYEALEVLPASTRITDFVLSYVPGGLSGLDGNLPFEAYIPAPVGGMIGGTLFTSIKVSAFIMHMSSIIYRIEAFNGSSRVFFTSAQYYTYTPIGLSITIFDPDKPIATNTLTRSSTKQMRFLAHYEFPNDIYSKDGKPVFIRAIRHTRMHTGGYRDNIYLNAIRTKQYNPNTSKVSELKAAKNINDRLKDKFCRLGIKLKVNKNTQESLDRFNVIASMAGRTWDKVTKKWSEYKTKTSNPAAVLLEVLTGGNHIPSRHFDEEIEEKSFGDLYDFCESQEVKIDGVKIPLKLECNGVITSPTRKIDLIKSILATCDSGLYINEYGKIIVYYDHKQEIPIALLNPQRIVSMVDSRNLNRKADGYSVEFIDEDSDYIQVKHRILRPKLPEKEPGIPFTHVPIKLDYTTSYNQAMWHARRLMAKEKHRPGEIKLVVGKEGRYYKPGSLIKVQNERFKIGLGSGEITEYITEGDEIIGLKLMEHFDIAGDRDYWIEYYVVDSDRNRVVTKKIQSVGEYTDKLMFLEGFGIPIGSQEVPEIGNILSALHDEIKTDNSEFNPPTVWESKRYLVSDLSEIEDGYELTLVEYSDVIYETTTTDNIPDRRSSILSSPPRVYNDQEDRQLMLENRVPDIRDMNVIVENTVNAVVPEIVSEKAPRYRGAFTVPGTVEDGVGIIAGEVMNHGDWVAYLGEEPVDSWRPNYCYRFTDQWQEVPTNDPDSSAVYMAALNDMIRNAPIGTFSHAFIGKIFAEHIVANLIGAKNIMLNKNGSIESTEFISINDPQGRTPQGFRLSSNGDFEANDGHFRGELQARYIRVTGMVSSGALFLLRANSIPASVAAVGGWISSAYEGLLKEIRTLAKGSCLLRMRFPRTNPARVGDTNIGYIRVEINDANLSGYSNYYVNTSNGDINIDIPNIVLLNDINTIRLYATPAVLGNMGPNCSVANTIFELRCTQDPGFLGAIG